MVETSLLRIIEYLPDGVTEVYLHPAVSPGPLTASMSGYHHAEELATLLSARVRDAIVATGVAIGGFGEVCPRLVSTL